MDNEIATNMANLDFSKKYKPQNTNDEIDKLGNNINALSDSLEDKINKLRKSNMELERDIEAKAKIDEMRKTFVSDVSHELKTPIALIQGYAEGLVDNVVTDEENRKSYAEVILDESNKMDVLVKRLIELIKLEYDDILLTSVGTIGEVARVNIKNPNYEFQRSVGLIKPNHSMVLSKYLLYALQSSFSQNSIKSSIKGGVQPCLFIDDIRNVEIKLYELHTQQHIVDSIGSVDDAIEKNEEIIDKIYCFLNNKFNELINNRCV